MAEIMDGAISNIKVALKETLEPITVQKREQIEDFIKKENPQYRHLVKYQPEALDDIPPDISDDKLDVELYKINQKFEFEVRQKGSELLSESIQTPDQLPEYEKNFINTLKKLMILENPILPNILFTKNLF